MSEEIYEYESATDRIKASLWWPAAGTVRRLERAIRMRDMILALMHCYFMPPLIVGWVAYDLGSFQASVLMPQVGSSDFIKLSVWDLDCKLILDIRWNEAGEVKVSRFVPNWWEGEFEDINFWGEKTRWRLIDQKSTVAIASGGHTDIISSDLPYLRERMANLRVQAENYASNRMHVCYANGDRERGEKWAAVLSAILTVGSPLTSDMLN